MKAFADGNGQPHTSGGLVLEYHGKQIRAQRMKPEKRPPAVYLWAKDLIDAGMLRGDTLPEKTDADGWVHKDIIAKHPNGNAQQTKLALRTLEEAFEAGAGKLQADGSMRLLYDGNFIHMQRMKAGSTTPICYWHQDLIAAGLMAESSRESLKPGRPSRTDLTPGSDHLKRTGRSRSGPKE